MPMSDDSGACYAPQALTADSSIASPKYNSIVMGMVDIYYSIKTILR